MAKKVLLTGSTGFTGGYVVAELCSAGYEVSCFIRTGSNLTNLNNLPVRYIKGDLSDLPSLRKALTGQDILVNVASIGFGHGPGIVETCEQVGVSRAIFFSTTAIFTSLEAASKANRLKAEGAIHDSKLNFTILRPTMIYGSIRDRNMIKLIQFVDKYPIIPIFGHGNSLQQPVYVNDLAKAVVKILTREKTVRKSYNLSGLRSVTYNDVVDTIAQNLNRRISKVYLPLKLSLAIVQLAAKVPGLPRFSVEQVQRLNENKSFSHQEAYQDFGYEPLSFEDGIANEIEEYRGFKGGR